MFIFDIFEPWLLYYSDSKALYDDHKSVRNLLQTIYALSWLETPQGEFVHYNFLKLHYIRHKTKDVSPLRVAALTCNITLYTLPPK